MSPWLNLTKLMSPTSWMWILASLVSVAFCFNIASRFVSRKMRMKLENIEIDLCPFRYWLLFNLLLCTWFNQMQMHNYVIFHANIECISRTILIWPVWETDPEVCTRSTSFRFSGLYVEDSSLPISFYVTICQFWLSEYLKNQQKLHRWQNICERIVLSIYPE